MRRDKFEDNERREGGAQRKITTSRRYLSGVSYTLIRRKLHLQMKDSQEELNSSSEISLLPRYLDHSQYNQNSCKRDGYPSLLDGLALCKAHAQVRGSSVSYGHDGGPVLYGTALQLLY